MRKKENEITDRREIDAIIQKALICHLSCSLKNQPYVVPLAFGYDGKAVYFHSAAVGKKNKMLNTNPCVCLGFESGVKIQSDPDQACSWSFHYQSVIANGTAEQLTRPEDKLHAINQIMLHYSGLEWEIPEKELARTTLWRVQLKNLTGKKSPIETNHGLNDRQSRVTLTDQF
jgi:nitroimidazol reductase NimA-like FMN-containing flavoprotein (pyridoxamine 5'-phosphate oxidase superfamily)